MHLQKSVVSCGAVFPRLPRARTRCTRSIRTALRSYLGRTDAGWSRLLDAHLLHFLSGQGDRLRGRADETGAAARIAHDIPGIVVHDHLDQNVAGEQLVLHHTLLAVLDLGDHLGRDLDVTDQILQVAVLHHGLQVVRDLVLIAGIGMHYIPKCLIGLFFHFGLPSVSR